MYKNKILVVDEKSLVAMEIKQKLENIGYKVLGIATTGKEAIEIAIEKNPDVILMDIMLREKWME